MIRQTAVTRAVVLSSQPSRAIAVYDSVEQLGIEISSVWTTCDEVAWPNANERLRLFRIGKTISGPDFESRLKDERPSLVIVAGLSSILPAFFYEIPKFGAVNLHGGPLPRYRGGSPLNWQIINGEKEIGVSIIRLNSVVDGGEILAEGSFPLRDNDDISSVHAQANSLFATLTQKVLLDLGNHSKDCRMQDEREAEYWHQRRREDGKVDWRTLSAEQAFNFIRGLTRPYPGAFSFLDNTEVIIYKSRLPAKHIRGAPGRVLFLQGEGPYVICRDRAIEILDYESRDGRKLKHGDQLI